MPRGGHNRKPKEQKLLEGTHRKDRDAPNAPAGRKCAVPKAPASLSDAERELWGELSEQVESLGVYSASDRSAFRLMVKTVALAEAVDAYMPPTARVRLIQAANTMLASFGLNPASRGKVNAAAEKPADPVAAEFFGIKGVVEGGKQ